ncbi:hypothetical protein Kpol_1033p9 [Vanderwaltozyma polyspora DSM 70294]|uniref:Phospholipid-transporting ATPase n=1 Tax=Vanderwaltozyma polyspora (strain ATCC 22028 / DSM 70294 / BCRC 21397 / CBS 2163 / NBRC 10782 / NRRL Y-8283 / UCD 57-17) TaxID=436907 RepID=A7TJ07_VANPO|nr:uncharacterized protein Kpol_1033p9 [Vanderwaltozyma polyspora DSM 70294]EDO17706.1 hypothetical protein Kpol_1033p9 [Vanderwaltozyma polyspora DSM 70294]
MAFSLPPGPNNGNKVLHYNIRQSNSTDSLDEALDNIHINNLGDTFETQDINNSSYKGDEWNNDNHNETIELRTISGTESDNNDTIRKSIHSNTRPLLNDPHRDSFDTIADVNNLTNRFSKERNFFHKALSSISSGISDGLKKLKSRNSQIRINNKNTERVIKPGNTHLNQKKPYSGNQISNAKYHPLTFVPILLYEQFKFFFNLYFLVVALSQAVPVLRIGYLSSYIVPLAFVITVTMLKEATDDIQRRSRDKELNNELYEVLQKDGQVTSKDLRVGDLIRLKKGSRVPADSVLLQTSEVTGEAFIKTDQLDGETDWKLRIAPPITQSLQESELIEKTTINASPPEKSIHSFLGKVAVDLSDSISSPLTIDNTLWANTVVASSGTCIACVVYTGRDTRQSMNTTKSSVKTGLIELEINSLSKLLCVSVFALSILLVAFAGFHNEDWYIDIMRYLILFSTIIPVSLRVNLDLAKSVYAYQIEHDNTIPETIVRTSTIPEDLGRIEYLLSDKTGTLTQNEMQLRKVHLGTVSYTTETTDIVTEYVSNFVNNSMNGTNSIASRKQIHSRVCDMILSMAICHNVIPTTVEDEITYQAASPDEIAIVKYTEEVGLTLYKRDRHSMTLLHDSTNEQFQYDILHIFPFNSDSKRMGIIVLDKQNDTYWFMEKGADSVMSKIVSSNTWLDEEVGNMAREGLRTLVFGRKKLSHKVYEQFSSQYNKASLEMNNRESQMSDVVSKFLEHDLELLGLTGVEDKLQKDVKSSIELLRNAGIKIWMLTGDKVETARCVSISAKLISRGQYVHTITKLHKPENALNHLEYLYVNRNACLLIDGESLGMYLTYYKVEFFNAVIHLPSIVACRCTPQQKADIAVLIRDFTGKRVCCIGDGGNDVSMIQCADVGVGIVGKEGKQASLAADFSITQFCHLTELLLWHGRNSYKRSAKLSQFVMHRGLVIAICQAVFSICSKFEPIALYQGWLMVGYATCYTMAPVFSLTLDTDIKKSLVKVYPELYKDLIEGKSLSYKTFFVWVTLSIYQGCIIQLFSQVFTGVNETFFLNLVALSFTALVLNETIMVALEISTWNKTMLITEIVTFIIYVVSVPFLSEYFDLSDFTTLKFYAELILILAVSVFPVWASKSIYRRMHPPSYAKVQQYSVV